MGRTVLTGAASRKASRAAGRALLGWPWWAQAALVAGMSAGPGMLVLFRSTPEGARWGFGLGVLSSTSLIGLAFLPAIRAGRLGEGEREGAFEALARCSDAGALRATLAWALLRRPRSVGEVARGTERCLPMALRVLEGWPRAGFVGLEAWLATLRAAGVDTPELAAVEARAAANARAGNPDVGEWVRGWFRRG